MHKRSRGSVLLVLICTPRETDTIALEMMDFLEKHGAQSKALMGQGTTAKLRQGMLLILWPAPIPSYLWKILQEDDDILDMQVFPLPQDSLLPAGMREHNQQQEIPPDGEDHTLL